MATTTNRMKLTTPTNGPGFTIAKPLPPLNITPPPYVANGTSREPLAGYGWAPARTDADAHLQYGSLVNGKSVPYRP